MTWRSGNPGAQGGVQSQLNQLANQSGGDYGVESRTIVNKQHYYIAPLPTVQMREGAVQYLGAALSVGLFGR